MFGDIQYNQIISLIDYRGEIFHITWSQLITKNYNINKLVTMQKLVCGAIEYKISRKTICRNKLDYNINLITIRKLVRISLVAKDIERLISISWSFGSVTVSYLQISASISNNYLNYMKWEIYLAWDFALTVESGSGMDFTLHASLISTRRRETSSIAMISAKMTSAKLIINLCDIGHSVPYRSLTFLS